MKKVRQRKCRGCPELFTPGNTLQVVCSWRCGLRVAEAARAKREREHERKVRAEIRERKERIKPTRDLLKEAQVAFNAMIRELDYWQPCISCGVEVAKWDAGHYRSVGAARELRFERLNVHKQCAQCNQIKSGNAIEYRIRLIERIGIEAVEWLEGPHEPKKWSGDELREMKRYFKAETRRLRQLRESGKRTRENPQGE